MIEALFAGSMFVLLTAAGVGALWAHDHLPSSCRHDDTLGILRLTANLFVVLTSLVLGFLINSTKTTFEAADRNLHKFGTEMILLDRTLVRYGPEAAGVRARLLDYAKRARDGQAPANDGLIVGDRSSERLLNAVGDRVDALTPDTPERQRLLDDARERFKKLLDLRWTLVEQSEGSLPWPLLEVLFGWLVLIFASFGYRAPRNGLVIGSLTLSALFVSSAFFLILDMDKPFDGPTQVSTAPLSRAIAEMTVADRP